MSWLDRIAEIVAREGAVARVVIVETRGPTPRAEGAGMLVWATGQEGKVGRPEVEARALGEARGLLARVRQSGGQRPAWLRSRLRVATGEVLGEASGGSVVLLVEAFGPAEAGALAELAAVTPDGIAAGQGVLARSTASGSAPEVLRIGTMPAAPDRRAALRRLEREPHAALVRTPQHAADFVVLERIAERRPAFCVYGTGLVARALVKVVADLPFDVRWLDTLPGHFPADVPSGVGAAATADPVALARAAPPGAFHAVMTADHHLDLSICRAVLEAGHFAYLGVIGSQVKRERMTAQLRDEGIAAPALARLSCPIGLPQIRSKVPAIIAVGIAAEALVALQGGAGTAQAAGSNL